MNIYIVAAAVGLWGLVPMIIVIYFGVKIARLERSVSELEKFAASAHKVLANLVVESQAGQLMVNHIDLYNNLAATVRQLKGMIEK